jgi:ribonuclease BN (tRNA processing enzyme)
LLIYETIYDDSMAEKAQEVGHSTIGQAIDAEEQLSAKWAVLTHFGARYNGTDMRLKNPTVIWAFDYMSFVFEDEVMKAAREMGTDFSH